MEDVNAIGYWEASRRYDLHESRLPAPVSSYVAVPVCMYVCIYVRIHVCMQTVIHTCFRSSEKGLPLR